MSIPTKWSLDNLYKSIDSEEFKSDFQTLENLIKELNTFSDSFTNKNSNITDTIIEYINLITRISEYYKIGSYLSLRIATNNKDSESIKFYDKFENLTTELSKPFASFIQYIKSINDLDELISNSSVLSKYKFFLNETKLLSKYALSESEEVIIDKFKISGPYSFEKLRDNTVSSILVEIELNGKLCKLPFSEIRNLAYDHNQEVRKNAYLAELSSYKNVEDTIASCLNSIKSSAITETKIRGYEDILDRTLINSRLSKESFNALISSIEESLPKVQKYFSHKAKLLGHREALPFYDLFASIGNANFKFTYEEAKETIVKNFTKFNPEVGKFLDNAFNNAWIDAFPSEGKRDGAFCSNIHQIKESRILSNFTGSFSDMSTLAHELGHAFHGECLKDEHYLDSEYPMPIAETASIFFETIILNEYLKNATEEEKITLLDNSITDSLQVLVDIFSRYLFESSFIKEREVGTLSTEEICQLMKDAQIKAYGDGLDKDFLHEYMWIAKPHYYSCDYNFYNFPYAFGMLFARGLYEQYEASDDKQKFYNNYVELLKSTGKNSLEDVALKMNCDITNKDFWQKSINSVIEEIEYFISITK